MFQYKWYITLEKDNFHIVTSQLKEYKSRENKSSSSR